MVLEEKMQCDEVWVPVNGFFRYEISNKRRVRLFNGRIIKVYRDRHLQDYIKLDGRKINLSFLLEVSAPDTRLDGIIWPL